MSSLRLTGKWSATFDARPQSTHHGFAYRYARRIRGHTGPYALVPGVMRCLVACRSCTAQRPPVVSSGHPGIGQGVRGLRGMGAIRRDHRGVYRSSVRVAGCEVDDREPASVPHVLNSSRHYGLCVRCRVGPCGSPVFITGEVRVIPVRSGVECVNRHHQPLLSRKLARDSRSSSANSAAFSCAFLSAWDSMASRMAMA